MAEAGEEDLDQTTGLAELSALIDESAQDEPLLGAKGSRADHVFLRCARLAQTNRSLERKT
jgi:hypothetical protein